MVLVLLILSFDKLYKYFCRSIKLLAVEDAKTLPRIIVLPALFDKIKAISSIYRYNFNDTC